MPTTRPKVPGWHPDPEDPASLRHWDGKRWGKDRRPRPSWAPLPRQAGLVPTDPRRDPGTPTKGSRRRWYALAAGALLLGGLVISVPVWLGSGPSIPPATVSDAGFIERANTVCERALPALRRARPVSREDTGTPQQFGARIDKAADDLAAVAADLRTIPVATAAEKAEVDGWLADWDAYIGLGHQYADAVRAEDREREDQLGEDSRVISTRIFVFAKANEIDDCTL